MTNPSAPAVHYDQYQIEHVSDWSVDRCKLALRLHERGDFCQSALLVDAFGRNSAIGSALRTRVKKATGLPFDMLPSDTDNSIDESAAAALEASAWWGDACEISEIQKLLRWGVTEGVSAAQIDWVLTPYAWIPHRIETWHPQHIWYDATARVYMANTQQGQVPIVPGGGKWILYTPEGGESFMDAAVRYLATPHLILSYSDVDWAHWSEVHGHPTRIGKFPDGAKDEDKNKFFRDLANIGRRALLLLPQKKGGDKDLNYALDLLEAKDTAWEGFKELIIRQERAINVGILGQTLTSGTSDGKGSYALGRVHADVFQGLTVSDVTTLAYALRRDLLGPWALYNRGRRSLAPRPTWDARTDEQRLEQIKLVREFAETARIEGGRGLVDLEEVARRNRIPIKRSQ